MRKLFFYEVVSMDKEAPKTEGSFNVDRVIRTGEYEPGQMVVLLDDFHEEIVRQPKQAGKNGKIVMESVKQSVSSQIILNEEDSKRFKALMAIPQNVEVMV